MMKLGKIGMRTIKTAISVSICVELSKFFNSDYIFYAAVAAVMAMQNSVSDSFKAGKNRMLGTIVGAFIGLIFAIISPGNTALSGIGIIIIIYICNFFNWKKSVTISCTVFLVIMLSLQDRGPVVYSLNRTFDTFLGIIVAVLVNYFISPPEYIGKVYEARIAIVDRIFTFVQDKLCNNKEIDLQSMNDEISKLEEILKICLSELRIKKQEVLGMDRIKNSIEVCKDIYMHLKITESLEKGYSLNEENYIKVKELFQCDIDVEKSDDDINNIVFNYHISKIIEGLNQLKNIA